MSPRYLRPGVVVGHLLVLAAALTCLRLGWWQWDVARASRGTVQNLGYAVLWPVFAGSFLYMWLRFLHLESVRDAELAEQAAVDAGVDTAAADVPPSVAIDRGFGAGTDTVAPSAESAELPMPASTSEPGSAARPATAAGGRGDAGLEPDVRRGRARDGSRSPREPYIISVATIGDDDDDDPELAAYNRALAALAEQDHRRAH